MYPEVPILSFISAALTLMPLTWYFRARNIAAMAIGIWLSVTNVTYAIDALIWAENTDIKAAVWCDISTVFVTGSRTALPAACLAVCIHLERLTSQTSAPQGNKRRRIIFECLMCFGTPVVYIALHLVVQPRRFDLFYGFGCRPATYPTIATIFLVMIPPLLLTAATIVYAGIAGRHFLIHGIQICGKRGSVSSLTRNLYLRLVGMALLETILSAALIAVLMWGVLSSGLAPITNMSRHLSEVLVWGTEEITDDMQAVLEIEWSVNVVQSFVFFGLFACRMEIVREGWEIVRPFLRLLRRPASLRRDTSEMRSMISFCESAPTFPITVVDLSLVIESASTLTPYGQTTRKSPLVTPGSLAVSAVAVEDEPAVTDPEAQDEFIIIPAIDPAPAVAMMSLESPSRHSAIASSHNSLESNFDPSQLPWPQTPTTIPVRFPRRPIGKLGCHGVPELRAGGKSRFWDVPLNDPSSSAISDSIDGKPAVSHHDHYDGDDDVRFCAPSVWTKFPASGRCCGATMEKRCQAICVKVVKETRYNY